MGEGWGLQDFKNGRHILFRRTLITVSSREILMVCGYMFYGTRFSNKPLLEFSGFQVRQMSTISLKLRHIEH